MTKFFAVSLTFVIATLPLSAFAGGGLDMINNEMISNGLFIPHVNDCSSTEVFLQAGSSSSKGFCIEKDERAGGAVNWEDARQTCAADNKRLPEAVEFRIACQAAPSGLVNTTDDQEWAGNFSTSQITYWGSPTSLQFITADLVGDGSCDYYIPSAFMSYNTTPGSAVFRCVR